MGGIRWLRRRRGLAAAGLAVVLAVSLAAAVPWPHHGQPSAPAQPVWGNAAAQPHRVAASKTIERLSGGRLVPYRPARHKPARPVLVGRMARMVVPPRHRPARVRIRVSARRGDRLAHPHRGRPGPVSGFNPRTSRPLPDQASADRDVYANADGTQTAMVFQTPVNYRRADGSWVPISTRLVPATGAAAQSASPAATPARSSDLLQLRPSSSVPPSVAASSPSRDSSGNSSPASASSAPPSVSSGSPSAGTPSPAASSPAAGAPGWREGSAAFPELFARYADAARLVLLPVDAGHQVGFGVAGAAHAAGSAAGDTVTYPAARPGSDLRFLAGAGLVKEQIILRSAVAPTSWVFPLTLKGLTARMGPGGQIEFTDATGRVRAVVPHGFMTDSNINPHSGDGAYSAGVHYSLTTLAGRPAIRMTLDSSWLDSPRRVFPVTVDPSVSSFNSTGTTYVQSPDNADFSSATELHAGTWDGGTNKAKAFMKFDVSSLSNDTVLGVRLSLFNSWSYSCSPRPVYVYPVTQSWSVTGTKTYPGPSTGAAIGRKSFATGWVPLGSTHSPCPASWQAIDLGQAGTNLVNGWTHGAANHGLALGASATDSYGWKKFTSKNNPTGDPFLAITYTPYGADYELASPHPVTQITPTQNGQIAIRVTNEGHDTWQASDGNGYRLSYRAYDAKGTLVADHPVFTSIPADVGSVAPGQTVTLDANVDALPAGSYAVDFDMYHGTTSFSSDGVPPLAVGLYVPAPPPVISGVYPPSGYLAPVNTPQLSTSPVSGATYQFTMTCQPLPGTTCPGGSISSGQISKAYWTPPPLIWNEPYTWTVTVTTSGGSVTAGPVSLTPEVPQPTVTSRLGGASGQAFDPLTGDYASSATDAAVAAPGPPLQIARTYNSQDPRTGGAFGTGWSSVLDMQVVPDITAATSSVVVTMPDGSQARFGYGTAHADGSTSYIPPFGSADVLQHNSDGTWSLMTAGGVTYTFTSGGVLSQITSPGGLTQDYANTAGQIQTVTDASSGRALHLTWSTPAGAAYPHVATVTTDPPGTGQPALTWSYSYTGDTLTQVCNPDSDCTGYSYGTSLSHFPTAVMDSGPRNYYRLDDPAGNTTAADTVPVNLGTSDGTYHNVTLGGAGPLAGSPATSASFDGTSSYVSLPDSLITDSTYLSVGLWFKVGSGDSGVLFGYQSSAVTGSVSGHYVPALYVGTDGKLRGEFWNGKADPITTAGTVTDGQWHYAVLTGSGTSQSLYLDGTLAGSMSGTIDQQDNIHDYIGAGFWSGGWPANASSSNGHGYVNGSLAEVAIYPQPLSAAAIAQQYTLATTASPELTQATLPSGRPYEQVSYDPVNDRVSSYTDPNGGTWTLHLPVTTGYKVTSESLGEATTAVTVADPAGRDEVYSYDAINGGRLTSYNRGAGFGPRTFGYDAAGCLNSVTDEDGNTVTFTNDARCNVLARSWNDVTGCPPTGTCTTYYSYYDNTASPLDPRNNQLTAIRDARSSSSADNTYLTSYSYNTAGQLTSSTTPATPDFPSGRTTSYTYSDGTEAGYAGGTIPAGLLLSATTPGGAATTYAYYANGDLAQVTEPSGRHTVYTYDSLGRAQTAIVYTTSHPAGLQTSYTYDSEGQPATVTFPEVTNPVTGVTHTLQDSYAYDSDGNITSYTQSDLTGGDPARTTSYTYDDHGQVATVTEPWGATTGGTPPPKGAPGPYPGGATTAYTWDGSGNLASMTDADGNEYDYTYNEYNQVTQVTLTGNSTDQSNPAGTSVVLDSYGYDPAGLLASATDALNRTTGYAYDPGERLIAITQTDPSTSPTTGRQTAYTYDNAGNVTSISRNGLSGGQITTSSVTDYTVDPAGRLTQQVLDPSGLDRVTSYSYDADDHPTQVSVTQSGASSTVSYGYDTAGDLKSQDVSDSPADQVTTWTYDQNGLPLTMTDPRGNATGGTPAAYTTSYTYDPSGQLSTVTGPPVQVQTYTAQTPTTSQPVTTYGYDTYGDLTGQTDPDGNTTTAGYDGGGRLTSLTQPAYTPPGSTSPLTATTSYTYDGLGQLTSATDPAGNTTSYAYDPLGDLTSQTDPQLTGQSAPGTWAWSYDNAGELQSAIDPTGGQTQYTWDYFGDLATATQDIRDSSQPSGTTSYGYDYLGDLTSTTSPDNVVTTSKYDAAGELKQTTDAYGDATSYTYNQLGEQATLTRPDQTSVSYGYDPAGNLTSTTEYGPPPSAAQVDSQTYGYDPAGNLTSATDGRSHTTTFSYDAASHITGETQPTTATAAINVSFGYDAAGNQTAYTDGGGNTTWTTYNPWNLPESVIEPATTATPGAAQRTYTTSYDVDSRPASYTEPGGVSLTAGYDQLGDLTQLAGSGAEATTPTQNYGYDLDGRLTSATAPGGTDNFTWNDASNLESTSGPSGTASFTYNADGQMASRADTAGTTGYTYDQAGRLATLADPATGATLNYGYTPNSQPATISYATGGTQGPTRTLTYTPLQQLATDTLTTPSGATIASASYGYNPDSDLTSQTTTGYAAAGTTTYQYDQANRLISATTGGTTTNYKNDAAGNLTKAAGVSYSYDARDQLTSSTSTAGTTSYTWTPRGTLDTITPPGSSAQNYTYNAIGQLATAPGGLNYAYDGLGRLTARTTSSSTQNLAYTGTGGTLASDGSQNYTYTPGGTPVGLSTGSGNGQSVVTDLHGDLTGQFTPTATATSLSGSAAYSPYGTITAATGTSSDLGYQGQWTDPATGQTLMGARWYNPTTGAFTSRDTWQNSPIPDTGNANTYSYGDANPITNEDPTGHYAYTYEEGGAGVITSLGSATWNVGVPAGGGYIGEILRWFGASYSPGTTAYDPITGGWGHTGLDPIWNYSAVSSSPWKIGYGIASARPFWGWSTPYYDTFSNTGYYALPYTPVAPPPPPPPPQDIYAGPNPAAAPAAPRWMRTAPYITQTVHDVTNPSSLLQHGPHIIEQQQPQATGPIAGLFELPTASAKPFTDTNSFSQQPLTSAGTPSVPSADLPGQPQPALPPGPVRVALPAVPPPATSEAGSTGAGSGGGGPPRQLQLPFPEPEPEHGDARFIADAQGNITDTNPPDEILNMRPEMKGLAGENLTATEINQAGGRVIGRQISVRAGNWKPKWDIFAELPNGQRVFVEVKTGETADLTTPQYGGRPAIMSQGGVGVGRNAIEARLDGPFGPTPVWVVHQPWPLGFLPP